MRWIRHPRRDLDAYLDDELDGHRAERVAVHLARCPRCRRRAADTCRIRRSLRAMHART
ncbi:MAG: zf-HC2 domain-containing protein [Acidimicrobiales bacterium]|nr:zf-HC2 domain-containing protein [Acidimicrobiales bacterium]